MIDLEKLTEDCSGHWGKHPIYRPWDWKQAVASSSTRLGYWQWVQRQIEMED